MKEVPLKRGYYIINYDLSSGTGTHWAVLEMLNSKKGIYCSSYGDPPLEVFWNRKVSLTYNNIDCQSFNSKMCGYFCIAYMLLRKRGYTAADIWQNFFSPRADNSKVDYKNEAKRSRNNILLAHLLTEALK